MTAPHSQSAHTSNKGYGLLSSDVCHVCDKQTFVTSVLDTNTANQHIRAIKAMDYSPRTFVTSVTNGRLSRLCWILNWTRPLCLSGKNTVKDRKKCRTTLNFWNFWLYRHELPKTTKGSLSGSTLLTHRQRRQLDHRMWPILTKRAWYVRRPIIRSTPVNRSKRYCTNEKWVWSTIANCA